MNAGIVFLTIIIFIVYRSSYAECRGRFYGRKDEPKFRSVDAYGTYHFPVYRSHLCSLPGDYSGSRKEGGFRE